MATIYFRTKATAKLNGEFENIGYTEAMMLAEWADASNQVSMNFAQWVHDSAKGEVYDCIEFYAEMIEEI